MHSIQDWYCELNRVGDEIPIAPSGLEQHRNETVPFEVGQSTATSLLISELPIEDPQFAELVSEFIVHARNRMAEVLQFDLTSELDPLAKFAHWMKGSGGMAGFPALTESARSLENSIQSANAVIIQAQLANLEELIELLQTPEVNWTRFSSRDPD